MKNQQLRFKAAATQSRDPPLSLAISGTAPAIHYAYIKQYLANPFKGESLLKN
ncbi:hypothetical protein KHS38_07550 [Mucilaginibacter sp. Bleaf8]|uniref:hypothetical protein n=1 Tax=Mucilaginibacter sp. Bleaf8 TaxID=2834430 RepID=UPI001BCB9D76|nr:hypothetical protein [Mucilaginibacter sp. Bleaf8]MBS7564256.1 hypothetical protein [Mucilaginibacter sp. Bleaf8]